MPSPGILASGLLWVLVFLGQERDAAPNQAKGQAKSGGDRKEMVADAIRSARAWKSWAETQMEMIRLKNVVALLRVELARVLSAQLQGGSGESAVPNQIPAQQAEANEAPRLIEHRSGLVHPGMGLNGLHVAFKPAEGDVNSPTSRGVPPPLITAPVTSLPATLPTLPSPSQQTSPKPSPNAVAVQPPYPSNHCPPGMVPVNPARAGGYFPGYPAAAKAWLYVETAPFYPGGWPLITARFLGYMPSGWDLPTPTYSPPVYSQPVDYSSGRTYGSYAPYGSEMAHMSPVSYAPPPAYGPSAPFSPPMGYGPSAAYAPPMAYGNSLLAYAFAPPYGIAMPWGYLGMDGYSPCAPVQNPCPPGTVQIANPNPASASGVQAYCAPPSNSCPPGTVQVANPNPASASGNQVYCAPPPTTAGPSPGPVTPTPAIRPVGQAQTTTQSSEPKAATSVEKTQAVELYAPNPLPGPFPTYYQPPGPAYYQPYSYPQYPQYIPYPGSAPVQAYPPQYGSYPYSPCGPPVMYPPVYSFNSGPGSGAQPPLVPFSVPTLSQNDSPQATPVLMRVLERLEALEKRLVASESTKSTQSPAPYAVFSPLAQPSPASPNP